jgi:hypothetical protein
MTGTTAAGLVSSPDPALFVNLLDFAGLTVCCRNAMTMRSQPSSAALRLGHSDELRPSAFERREFLVPCGLIGFSDAVAMGAIADTTDAPSKRRF